MQENDNLSTHEPTIRTQNNASNSPVPLNQNEAKNKLKTFLSDLLQLKITVNNIKYNDLLIVFDHEKGQMYYLKDFLRNNTSAVEKLISENKQNFTFMN